MTTPREDFSAWLDAHYSTADGTVVCRRCGKQVGYVTKHAVERHGDPIEVMPAVNDDRRLTEAY